MAAFMAMRFQLHMRNRARRCAGRCRDALQAYQEALTYAPNNRIARQRSDFCREKVSRFA
jgi:hypothetical protein